MLRRLPSTPPNVLWTERGHNACPYVPNVNDQCPPPPRAFALHDGFPGVANSRQLAAIASGHLVRRGSFLVLSQIGTQRRKILDGQHSEICVLHAGIEG
jgi:hypothetical protein